MKILFLANGRRSTVGRVSAGATFIKDGKLFLLMNRCNEEKSRLCKCLDENEKRESENVVFKSSDTCIILDRFNILDFSISRLFKKLFNF
tara:strand:- start:257 stop:526 length:270 start_codon:yes stop_codon:yes gene_type:complete